MSLLAVACKGPAAPAVGASSGTLDPNAGLTYALNSEPANFNVLTSNGAVFDGVQIMDRIWPSVFHTDPAANVVMDTVLMESVTLATSNPQTVVYKINPKAVWSDGVAFNSDDFTYNWQAQSNQAQYKDVGGAPYDVANTAGYSQVSGLVASPDKFTVTATFSSPYPDWKRLFTTMAPAHVLQRIGWNTGLLAANVKADTLVSAGPFTLASYAPGKDLTVRRNPAYWGPPANLARVVYRFVTDSTQVEPALAAGEINAAYPPPQLDLVQQLKALPAVTLDQRPGLEFEHLDFNETNPFLKDVILRRAIAIAIDRPQLIAKTVGQFAQGIVPDGNHIFVPTQPQYRDNSSGTTATATVGASPGPYASGAPGAAIALLTAHGYTRSSTPCCPGGASTLLSEGGMPVTLRITAKRGDALRGSEEDFVANALAQIGIQVTRSDAAKMGTTLTSGDYDLAIYSFKQTPFATDNDGAYLTGAGQNFNHYSDPQVDALLAQADVALDPAVGAGLHNQVDALLWQDMVSLPLFQKPTLLVYDTRYRNLQNNITSEGPVYDEEQWGAVAGR